MTLYNIHGALLFFTIYSGRIIIAKNMFNFFKINSKEDFNKIFQLSWPVMVGMSLQSLLGTVDMAFISSLGTSQAAAASLGNTASGVIFVMSSLVSAGTIALISRSYNYIFFLSY